MEEHQPLMLCMENAAGEEVNLRIEPEDDFHSFLDKAKSVLGYDIDLTSLTNDQPVDLNENVYQFLLNLELNHPDIVQTLDQTGPNDDQEYVLDDGTEIRASQIHFDNEDASIDLTLEKLPFVKLNDDEEENTEEITFEEVTYKIAGSPKGSLNVSPKHNFINGVPFKLVCNNTTGFEAQFTKYLESYQSTKTYATLNNVTKKNKSPRSLIKDNFNNKEKFRYTREEILNMLKDSPVTSIPYEVNEKKHVRKTDPTRMIQKSTAKALDINGLVIGDGENRNCFICGKNVIDKLYIFDKEDQKIYRCTPQMIISTQLKVICENCLNDNFKPSRMKGANQFLNSDEYLVIKNNQQYIFQKTKSFKFRTGITNKETKKIKNKDEFVKVEIGSDGEIVTKPIDNDDDVIIINDDRKDSSSDVELVEPEPEIDKFIDNLEDADEEVKQFLGKYEDNGSDNKELKCRFCEQVFPSTTEVVQHGETHKHDLEDDVVFPCPLCDYGYSTFNWLKGHIKAAHERKNKEINTESKKDTETDIQKESGTSIETTISLNAGAEKRDESKKNIGDTQKMQSYGKMNLPDLIIKTEVKQECVSSDEEIWIVQTADAEATKQLGKILKDTEEKGRKGHKCYNCSQFFPSALSLSTHKCRGRARIRKADDELARIPGGENLRRIQGRPQPQPVVESGKNNFMIESQRKKAKDNSEIVTCHDCNQSFTSKVRLKFHMQFHFGGPLAGGGYRCGQCAVVCNSETELFDHVHFRHDKRKRWQCPHPHCEKTFYLRATLTKHSRTHTDTRRYVCVKCGKRFFDKQTLDEHGVTHLQIKPYQCHICLKQLTRVSRLRMHVRAHRERAAPARAPACAHCARAFRDTGAAQEHASKSIECIEAFAKKVKEGVEEPTVQLSPTSGLVRHTIQVIESPEPTKRIKRQVASPIAEPLLSQLTEEARALIRVVEIDKAFRCEYCEEVFYIEEGLNKHRAIHKGVKNPFTCHICKVSFATYSRCTTHKTTHGFYKQGAEARALPDFPVVKHFLCEDCGRSYLHWTYLQVHRRMKHPNENFQHKCSHCEMTFPNSWSLAYHRKKFHGKTGQGENTKTGTQDYRQLKNSASAIANVTNPVAQSSSVVTETRNLSAPICFENTDDGDTISKVNDNLSVELKQLLTTKQNVGKESYFGRRIVNVSQFFNQLQQISSHGPLNCGLESAEIISETRIGLTSQFKLKCKMCNMTFLIHSDNPIDEMDINTSAVAGAIAIGCGYSQLTEISAAIGLVPMSKKIFATKMEVINNKWENELLKSMTEAAEEERCLAIEEGRVHSNGIAIIDVIADGCYGKRSYKKNYSSLSGAAAIIGKRTNKILYLAVKNKYCCICALAQNKSVEAKDHICYKNYSGASSGMESEILTEGFKKSLEMHNLIYGRLIADGDANTYSKILQSRPYDNYTVEKVECRNHLLRNMCNKLAAISTDTKYILKYRKYITKKRILSTRKVIIEAIKKYKNSNYLTSLHQDIIYAPDHAFGRHGKCKEYFCSKTEEDENIDKEMFSNSIWQRIKLITTQLAAHARSLILDVDSNSVERYHSVVAKFVGGKRINFSQRFQYQMRCNAAALSFNTQKLLSILHKSIVGRSPHNEIKRHEEKMRKSRRQTHKYLRKKRRLFHTQDTRNYGDNCSKPDIDEDMMAETKRVFLQNLQKNSEERQKITEETVLQSGSSEWLELRRNILTASNFGRVIKRRIDVSCQNMVKDILYKRSIEHIKSIKHGRDSEKRALEQLSQQENVEIHPCGLYIDPDVPYLGATPDGVINKDMVVEIKCPKTSYNIGIEKAVDEKKLPFYKKNKDGLLEINKGHYWYFQIQGQLHVTRREKCLFGLWSGNNFPVKTEIIQRDDEFWSCKMEKKLKDFYLDCLLPELVDPRFTRKLSIRDPAYVTEAINRKKAKQGTTSTPKKRKMTPKTDQPSTSTAQSTLPKRRKTAQATILSADQLTT